MARSLKQETNNPNQSSQENPWIEGIKTIATAAILAFGIRPF